VRQRALVAELIAARAPAHALALIVGAVRGDVALAVQLVARGERAHGRGLVRVASDRFPVLVLRVATLPNVVTRDEAVPLVVDHAVVAVVSQAIGTDRAGREHAEHVHARTVPMNGLV